VKFLPRFVSTWVGALSLAVGVALLGSSAFTQDAQNSQNPNQQNAAQQNSSAPGGTTQNPSSTQTPAQPRSASAAVRALMQQQAERRRAQALQQSGAQPQPQATPQQVPPPVAAPSPNAAVATPATTPTSVPPASTPTARNQPAVTPLPAAKQPSEEDAKQPAAAVKSVKVVHENGGSAIEIMTSRPVPPALQTLSNPPRLVVDLPNALVSLKKKTLGGEGEQFTAIRVDQFQVAPPVTRIVVDLVAPREYTWDAAGNRLTIRLKPAEEPKPKAAAGAQPVTVPTLGSTTQPAVVPVSTPTGSMVTAGSRIGSGSSVTAGAETAVLHIARGGEVHVCPGSTVSITASRNGQELMLGMSTGALETHYHLEAASDSILTPDFRILLAGPGDFDFAISSNSHGDACVRALLGNTAPVVVSELMGDRTYQVRPTEQVVFHEGRIDRMSNDVPFDCGCASPPPAVMRASTAPPPVHTVSDANLPPNLHLPSSSARLAPLDPMLPPMPSPTRTVVSGPAGSQVALASGSAKRDPLAQAKPTDIRVQLETPFVYRGNNQPSAAATQNAQNLPPKTPGEKVDPPAVATVANQTDPAAGDPAPKKQAEKHGGFFGRMKGFFSSVFK